MGIIIKRFEDMVEQTTNLQWYGKWDQLLFSNKLGNKVSYTRDSIQNTEFWCEDIFGEKLYKIDNPRYMGYLNIVPNGVRTITAYDSVSGEKLNTVKVFMEKNDFPLYKVGLMSDVHYNDTDNIDDNPDTVGNFDGSEYSEDLKNALEFFKNEEVDFISCSGDISTDYSDHLRNYKYCIDKYGETLSIFTCCGNHDTKPKYKNRDLWLSVMAIDRNNEYEIHRFKDYEVYSRYLGNNEYDNNARDEEGTSFYFKKYFGDGENDFDIYIYLNLEYNHKDRDNYWTHDPEKLIQSELLVHDTVGYDDYHMYDPNTLLCLEGILEEFKEHRCFIFTHIMFKNGAGTYHGYDLYNYYNGHSDVMRGDQGEFCERLMNKYPKTYWFSGHSHYKWYWQRFDKDINVKRMGSGAYTIHIPSLARPLNFSRWYDVALTDSEAGIMEVYKDYVTINGYVLKENNSQSIVNIQNSLNEYPEENITRYIKASDFNGDTNYFEVNDLENNTIEVLFKGEPYDININIDGINPSNNKVYMPVFIFDYVYIEDENGNDITKEAMEEHKIGIRDNTTDTGLWDYYFESRHIYTVYNYGVLLKLSSTSIFSNQTIKVRFKARYNLIKLSYNNERYTLATYKLK